MINTLVCRLFNLHNVISDHIGAVTGFTNLGEVYSHLSDFEKSLDAHSSAEFPSLANSMLVLFVRGLFSSLKFPYAQFPCRDLRGQVV